MEKIKKTDQEWRAQLSDLEFQVTRRHGTERAFTGPNWDSKEKGTYSCRCCGLPLFDSGTKYESGTGWPSFYAPIEKQNVAEKSDNTFFMRRTTAVALTTGRCSLPRALAKTRRRPRPPARQRCA